MAVIDIEEVEKVLLFRIRILKGLQLYDQAIGLESDLNFLKKMAGDNNVNSKRHEPIR